MGNWNRVMGSILTPKYVEHEVGNATVRFWPISPGLLFKLKTLARPVTIALAQLFEKTESDAKRTMRNYNDPASGEVGSETVLEAVSLEMAQFRSNQKEMAIDKLLDAFTHQTNQILLARIIFDSCRELFDRGATDQELEEWLNQPNMTIGELGQFLRGVAKANEKVFGPLGEKASSKLKEAMSDRTGGAAAEGETEMKIPPTESPIAGDELKAMMEGTDHGSL